MEDYKNRMSICPICKKEFIPAPEHAWKIRSDKLVCSYTCMRVWERVRYSKKSKKKDAK